MSLELEERIIDLENWKSQIEISRAREDVEKKHIDLRFDAVEKKLSDISSTARQLTYAVASAIIVYLVTFVMNGGLTLVKHAG